MPIVIKTVVKQHKLHTTYYTKDKLIKNAHQHLLNQHVRLNFEKELKSTVWGREFQQFITRLLKKLARTQFVVWRLP